MVTSRIWFTAAQKAELWERWKNGQSAAGVNGSRKNGFVVTVSTRALNGGRGASVAACAAVAWGCARSHCSCRAPIGQLQRLCRALPTARLGS